MFVLIQRVELFLGVPAIGFHWLSLPSVVVWILRTTLSSHGQWEESAVRRIQTTTEGNENQWKPIAGTLRNNTTR